MTICIFKGRFWVEYFRNISLFYIYFYTYYSYIRFPDKLALDVSLDIRKV